MPTHDILAERKAHAPLLAAAHVDHGVEVEIEVNHRNKAAGRGCHDAACYLSSFSVIWLAVQLSPFFRKAKTPKLFVDTKMSPLRATPKADG